MHRNQIIKTIFFLILILIFTIFLVLFCSVFFNKTRFENSIFPIAFESDNDIFSINKITFFSSCNSNSRTNSNSTITIENLYQFTDIAIFIDNNSDNIGYNSKNTLKEVYIDNISFSEKPSLGTPSLYYQTLDNFASGKFLETNSISSNIARFNISSEYAVNYSSLELQNNCSKPITLCYVNSDIIDNYTITSDQAITYDGSLLDVCNIPVTKLNCSISFDIYIINNLNEKFKCPVHFDIPLNSRENSIQDGNYIVHDTQNFIFYEIL